MELSFCPPSDLPCLSENILRMAGPCRQVVFYAAVFRAVQSLKAADEEVESALSKSQLGPLRDMAS